MTESKLQNRQKDRGSKQNCSKRKIEQVIFYHCINIKCFDAYNSEWLDFVASCRIGEMTYKQYDVICGGIANERVFNTLDLYFSNQMTKEEALKRLIFEKPNQQLCFTNQEAIDSCITYIESKELL